MSSVELKRRYFEECW